MDLKSLVKTKTFWTGVSGVIAAVGGAVTGAMDPGTAIQTGIGSLLAIFLREGVAKG
ncbi:MAG: hypothetical protein GY737_13910 [Desulfobacteraceae bacterium]|nr:hypothetical protein [Desulfobacteraceae bacterium]